MQPLSFIMTKRFLFYVVFLSIFLLVFSCFTLLRSSSSYLIPESVLMLVLANKTSELSTQFRDHSTRHLDLLSSHPTISRVGVRRNSNSKKDARVLGEGRKKLCDTSQALLKVYMYDLPPRFHFGLLGWKGKKDQIWPDVRRHIPSYPGGLNLQHSVEYWLTLDLLSSNSPGVVGTCSAIRVMNSSHADVIFVPFFSSLSYNRHSKLHGKEKVGQNKVLQNELVDYLMRREEWRRGGGKDHVIVAHHPNSMSEARRKLGSAIFLLADFGRYPVGIANLKKDVIAPYMHVVPSVGNDSTPFEDRPILAYFQGAILRKDVSFFGDKLLPDLLIFRGCFELFLTLYWCSLGVIKHE